jgi:hypothetical protein
MTCKNYLGASGLQVEIWVVFKHWIPAKMGRKVLCTLLTVTHQIILTYRQWPNPESIICKRCLFSVPPPLLHKIRWIERKQKYRMCIDIKFHLKRRSFHEYFVCNSFETMFVWWKFHFLVSSDLRFTPVWNQVRLIKISFQLYSFCISFETMFVLPPLDFCLAHSFLRVRLKQTFHKRFRHVWKLFRLCLLVRMCKWFANDI